MVTVAPDVPADRRPAALEAGPDFIDSTTPYRTMLDRAGFVEIAEVDVSAAYHRTAVQWLAATRDLEPGLRRALGDSGYEERLDRRTRTVAAIEAGLLARFRYIAGAGGT